MSEVQDDLFERPEVAPRSSKAAARAARRQERVTRKPAAHVVKPLEALNANQAFYINTLRSGDSTFAIGAAGTGKTYVASRIAAQKLQRGEVERIIVARPTVSKSKHANGFLPGKLGQKLAPWLVPVYDGLKAEISPQTLQQWEESGKLEIASFEHMRGRTFGDAFVILDEAQNCDIGDLRLFLTRIGAGSQVVISGDVDQVDIPNSGLADVVRMCMEDNMDMEIVQFSEDDVVRGKFAKMWVKAFAKRSPSSVNLDITPAFLNNPGTRKAA